ncbi:hypothetical protein C5167_019903 [Papaver somniferum]|uniref:Uncharacterized protein n=1 Tax=Papaver somniferum TaxID=3469 RepID=A0A4Y7IVE8_PAPSO|nr:uncharacterized protein LOC113354020 [Papaver somniferum]RZC51479.1 hypothetical protein C5167_019903 [Papaver somniferum]
MNVEQLQPSLHISSPHVNEHGAKRLSVEQNQPNLHVSSPRVNEHGALNLCNKRSLAQRKRWAKNRQQRLIEGGRNQGEQSNAVSLEVDNQILNASSMQFKVTQPVGTQKKTRRKRDASIKEASHTKRMRTCYTTQFPDNVVPDSLNNSSIMGNDNDMIVDASIEPMESTVSC